MSSIVRRAASKLLKLIRRVGDPVAEPDRTILYVKPVAGVPRLHARDADGQVTQLTPILVVDEEGAPVGQRPELNFIGGAVTAVDDPGNNRVNVIVTAANVTVAVVPEQIDVGDAGVIGVSTEAARADHQHALPAPPAPVNVTKAAADAGAATTVARSDHKHDVDTAAPITVTGGVNGEGAATSLARSNHQHRLELEVEEEGVLIGARPTVNFIGPAVTAVDAPGDDRVNITISAAAGAAPAVLGFGDGGIGAAADTRFLSPWYGDDLSFGLLTPAAADIPVPRAGTLRNLFVRHNTANGNGASVVYTIMVNGVATALTVTLATGAIGQGSDLVNSVVVAQGDRVRLRAVKPIIMNGNLRVVASCDVAT